MTNNNTEKTAIYIYFGLFRGNLTKKSNLTSLKNIRTVKLKKDLKVSIPPIILWGLKNTNY
jgi:hypothetical protein